MFRVAGHLLDHTDVHVLCVTVAGGLEAVPEHDGAHQCHYHELEDHFDFYSEKSNYLLMIFFKLFKILLFCFVLIMI